MVKILSISLKVVLPSRGCSKQSVLAFGPFGYFS